MARLDKFGGIHAICGGPKLAPGQGEPRAAARTKSPSGRGGILGSGGDEYLHHASYRPIGHCCPGWGQIFLVKTLPRWTDTGLAAAGRVGNRGLAGHDVYVCFLIHCVRFCQSYSRLM